MKEDAMKLTNMEFMLLQITCERTAVSDYEINRLVRERGYQDWVDIGTTSVDGGLNNLSKKQLVNSCVDTTKSGKSLMPQKFEITNEGKKLLQQEIIAALSSSRERDYRFDLALAAIPLVTTEEVVTALEQRKDFLAEVAQHINTIFESQGGKELPVNLQALFRHSLLFIKHEIDFMDILLQEL
jgi:DNA-binding PadR family transcriptional regulator